MATSERTLPLPKIQQPISRRAVMGTGLLATALAAVPVLAALPEPNPDAALIAACDDWQERERRCNEAFKVTDVLHEEARAKEPPVPVELFEELDLPPEGPRGARNGKPWDPRDLKIWADSGKRLHVENIETGETITVTTTWLPIPEATRIRAAELLAIHQRYERAKRRVWAKHNRAEKVADCASNANFDRLA